jgi:hypothetical protein
MELSETFTGLSCDETMALMITRVKTITSIEAIITPSILASRYFKKLLITNRLIIKLNNINKSHVLEQEIFNYVQWNL